MRAIIIGWFLAAALLLGGDEVAARERLKACAGRASLVYVDTSARRLHLCEGGASVKQFPVALGTRGIGKRKQGDWKTQLGTYGLSAPRASSSFGTFIL